MGRQLTQGRKTDSNEWTSEQRLLARRMFKLRIHEAKGMEFQRLFEKVMQYAYPGKFLAIKPYGNVGDRKNDGYVASTGTYHQVFAPEQPKARETVVAAAKKATGDFTGLKVAWDKTTKIAVYRFVFNDEYTGCPPDVALACDGLAKKHSISARAFIAADLEDEVMKLSQEQILDIIQMPIPRPDLIHTVDFGVLSEIIKFVLDNPVPLTKDGVLNAPDFSEKVEFNGISTQVGHLLHTAGRQIEAVNDYFSRNSQFAKQALRNKLNGLYVQSRRRFIRKNTSEEFGDLVFFDLLEHMVPETKKADQGYPNAQNAALVVAAFYFDSCDVFEDPNAAAR